MHCVDVDTLILTYVYECKETSWLWLLLLLLECTYFSHCYDETLKAGGECEFYSIWRDPNSVCYASLVLLCNRKVRSILSGSVMLRNVVWKFSIELAFFSESVCWRLRIHDPDWLLGFGQSSIHHYVSERKHAFQFVLWYLHIFWIMQSPNHFSTAQGSVSQCRRLLLYLRFCSSINEISVDFKSNERSILNGLQIKGW